MAQRIYSVWVILTLLFHKHDIQDVRRFLVLMSDALPFHAMFCENSNADTRTFNAKIRPIFLVSTTSVLLP